MGFDTLEGPQMRCVVGDNSGDPQQGHHAGLNGVWSLQVRDGDGWTDSVFSAGGLNLEHYFDRRNWRKFDAPWTDQMIYEPRHHPMALSREGDALVLSQTETPFWGVQSKSTFHLARPDALAFRCELTPRRRGFEGPDLAAFWANYMRKPEDPGLWYCREGIAHRHWHDRMGDRSTICGPDEPVPEDVPGSRWLFHNFAPERFDLPLMWGAWRGRLWGMMLRGDGRVRLAIGPTGGGPDSPAWDFQWIVPGYEVGRTYTLEAEVIVARITPEELRDRCAAWMSEPPKNGRA